MKQSTGEPDAFKLTLSGRWEYQPILTGRPTSHGMRSGRVALARGEESGRHSTRSHEEVLIILEGSGSAHLAGRDEFHVRAGDVLYVPPHTEHNVVGGADGLKYVYVVAPVEDA